MTAVRIARDEELPAIVAAMGQEHFFVDRLDRQRRGLGQLLVAWRDGRPIGDVYLGWEAIDDPDILAHLPGVPQVSHLEVAAAYRRQGVAALILEEAERLAFERGHGLVTLGVGVTNVSARALYDRRGYVDWEYGPYEFRWEEPGPDGVMVPDSEMAHVLVKLLDPAVPGLDRWDAWHPREAALRFGGSSVPWFVAAGWAIDLYLGEQSRPHGDLELAIPRAEFGVWRSMLTDFDLYEASPSLRPLAPDATPGLAGHQVWVCEPAVAAWRMDTFLLEDGDGVTWVSHRDDRIRAPITEVVARTADGIPYLRPGPVLLGKAKHSRPKDEADFDRVLPTLDPAERAWLAGALGLVHPGHPWIDRVAG